MSAAEARPMAHDHGSALRQALERQRKAHVADGPPSAEKRVDWLDRAIGLIVGNRDAIADALREDFGHRSVHATLLTDVSGSIGPLKFAKEHLRSWMRPEKRKVNPAILGMLIYPKAMTVLAVMMSVFALVPGLPMLPFLVLAILTGMLAYTLYHHGPLEPALAEAAAPGGGKGTPGKGGAELEGDEEQVRLHHAASKCFGALASGNAHRSETARQAVRQRLRRHYGR